MTSVSYRYSLKYLTAHSMRSPSQFTTHPTKRSTLLKQLHDEQTEASQMQYWIREPQLHAIKIRRGPRCH
jgi:hypothetical protein